MTVRGDPADISENWLGDYFSKFGLVEDVFPIMSKMGIVTGIFVLQVVVEGRRPQCGAPI